MTDPHAPRAQRGWTWTAALAALVGVTLVLLAVRAHVDKVHITLALLLVVLVGSAAGGRVLGLTLAALAFLIFDYFFLPPYYTLAIQNPLDWLVLASFLVTSVVAAQLLTRAQERANAAHRRAIEVERLAMLGAEALNAGRAEEALEAITRVIRDTLRVACCEIFIERGASATFARVAQTGACDEADELPASSLAAWVAHAGTPAAERGDRTAHIAPHPGARIPGAAGWGQPSAWTAEGDIRALLVPLHVRDRTVGVLRISHSSEILLDPEQRQFLDALSYYASLAVERVRLVAEAERADAFRQADQLKDALIAAVSHDLRTPLTTIKAAAHRLATHGAAGSAETADAVSIEEEADRLNRTVADLLDLSRLNAGAMPLHLELNVADELIGAAIQRVAGVRKRREIAVRGRADDAILTGTFDFVQSLRVVSNLLENAIKYSPADTPIEIGVERRGDRLEFQVADRGPGIPEEERERIFTPFYRPAGTPSDVGGAGLGLAIARRIAEAEGGHVRCEPRPGGGSVFVFDVPAADVPSLDAGIFTRF